ncbi:hypothetical protein NUU61_007346 [Penicillium alfredii]|uniref:DUF7702 domain-containing protein n=1 Tax=Penicillium alfredii TaxID=1506179 RepID=A0A9W9K4N1_9EURO|nr:uncharacterized protein NUU61_007346 [Penicillium alfredii]KAJ5092476.1 hypothetical protein NUU61_007346 [Penicillium alfredii]
MAADGLFTYRDGIAVAQVVLFSIPLLFAIYFKFTHRIGWFCIGVFTLLRLTGASCKLATIHNDSHGLWAGIFVCESLGMILIIFLLLELLERANKMIPLVSRRIFLIPSLLTWIDIAVSIAGWVAVMHVAHPLDPTPESRASMALLVVIYLYSVGVFVVFWRRRADYAAEERAAITAVAACVPLLAVRIAYSLVFISTADMTFNAIKGDSTAYLVMTMLPEVAIVGVCTFVIFARVSPLVENGNGEEERETRKIGG